MIKEALLKKLNTEDLEILLGYRQVNIDRANRVMPRIDRKMVDSPNWKAICPKSGCELTLDIIKEELQAYLEEAEEDVQQLNKHLERLAPPKSCQMELGL